MPLNTDYLEDALSNVGFKSEKSHDFVRHWFSLRGDALVPRRQAFDPADVPHLLANISIHEFVAPERIELRLAGTKLVERYGQEITGRNYLDFVPEARREKTYELLSHIIKQPCGMLVRMRTATNVGILGGGNESVGLPFHNRDGLLNTVMYHVANWEYDRSTADPGQRMEAHFPTERVYFDLGAGLPDWDDEPYPVANTT
ncbi:MAG: PAS domain-containing protein [Rhodospirillaceae bacterium]|nr:PAS domain-containing protein [Rhodospirillaceae bacterium]MBT4485938.1 PAS domain-containing protein [Rhodospirillaceae bacterium]MBT5894305.1 PAS domain-containing protein [Rhodospirillaceae bacterium]MBT6426306.1 PAS domain-containing protein [Rhodospirillaceae bacterium]MBT6986481.1 PAS domain-containing protein [Rhodospirillaceae bacterium]